MKANKITIMSVAVLTALMFLGAVPDSFAVSAHGKGGWNERNSGEHEKRKEKQMQAILEEIGLSGDQLQKIDAHRKRNIEEGRKMHEKMASKHEALREAVDAAATDRARIDVLVNEFAALHAQEIRDRTNHILELKEILTPEQFAQLKAKKDALHEKRKRKKDMRQEHSRWHQEEKDSGGQH